MVISHSSKNWQRLIFHDDVGYLDIEEKAYEAFMDFLESQVHESPIE